MRTNLTLNECIGLFLPVEIYDLELLLRFSMIPFKARPDGKIAVTLDNNAWHFFFTEEIDLAKELPSDRFAITMPREVDIEWQAAPNGGDNDPRKRYIEAALSSGTVEVRWLFGFSEMNPASGPRRVAGFDQASGLRKKRETLCIVSRRILQRLP